MAGSEEVTVSIPLSTLMTMRCQLNEALAPKVKYSKIPAIMRDECDKIRESNIRSVMVTMDLWLK